MTSTGAATGSRPGVLATWRDSVPAARALLAGIVANRLGSVVGGTPTDRLGPRRTILLAMTGRAALLLSILRVRNYPALPAVVVLAGTVGGAYRPAAGSLLSELTPRGQQVMTGPVGSAEEIRPHVSGIPPGRHIPQGGEGRAHRRWRPVDAPQPADDEGPAPVFSDKFTVRSFPTTADWLRQLTPCARPMDRALSPRR